MTKQLDQQSIAEDVLSSPSSRSRFLRGAAVAAASLGVAPVAASAATLGAVRNTRAGMYENTKMIVDIAATAEALAVTAFYNVHLQVNAGKFDVKGIAIPVNTLVSVVRAILREEQDHYAFLIGAGAKPLLTSFTFPPAILTNAVAALNFVVQAESIFVAAYMAANREFAHHGLDQLAQYTYQIGGTEAEHRTVARAALGKMPANNKSFESNLYMSVQDAANELTKLGLLKPGVAYPGAMAVDHLLATTVTKDVTAGVIQRRP